MKREAGGRGAIDEGSSLVGMGVSGAEVMAERLRGVGEAVDFIWVFDGVAMLEDWIFRICRWKVNALECESQKSSENRCGRGFPACRARLNWSQSHDTT